LSRPAWDVPAPAPRNGDDTAAAIANSTRPTTLMLSPT